MYRLLVFYISPDPSFGLVGSRSKLQLYIYGGHYFFIQTLLLFQIFRYRQKRVGISFQGKITNDA
jgi:hypothetical protein